MNTEALKKLVRLINHLQQIYLSELWPRHLQSAAAGTLTARQALHLMQIRGSLPCNLSRIMFLTGLSSSAASLYVDEMVRKNILIRRGGVKDKRSTIVDASAEAAASLKAVDEGIDRFLQEVASGATPKQQREIDRSLELLGKMLSNVDIEATSTWSEITGEPRRSDDIKLWQ